MVRQRPWGAYPFRRRPFSDDWERLHGWRPVLCETFVDETRFRASCYRAANWERIGETAGRGKSRKGVYVKALCEGAQDILRGEREGGKPAKPPTRSERGRSAACDRRFNRRWEVLVAAAVAVAAREDARWQKRRRVFDSLLIMLFVFRLVVAPRGQGYRATLCELWEQCAAAGVELPQDEPPAAATACEAREKLDEAAFKRLHRKVLAASPEGRLWKGHRILAVDGSKITLPRELAQHGYRLPNDGAHYPRGMVSVLYRLHDRLPVDFDLFNHENEREAALAHLDHAGQGDVIVHDRGYFSFAMALAHRERGLDFVFRIRANATPPSTPSPPRARTTGPSRSQPPGTRPRCAAGASPSAWSATRPGTPTSALPPPCSTATATASRRSPTSTTPAGASRRCTRPARR